MFKYNNEVSLHEYGLRRLVSRTYFKVPIEKLIHLSHSQLWNKFNQVSLNLPCFSLPIIPRGLQESCCNMVCYDTKLT
jgi:hypothetical protein